MAGSLENFLLSCFSFFLFDWDLGAAKTHGLSRNITPVKIGQRQDKLSHLRFYSHDNLGGPSQSVGRDSGGSSNQQRFEDAIRSAGDDGRPLDGGAGAEFQGGGKSAGDIRVCIAERGGLFDGVNLRFHARQIQRKRFERSGTQHYNAYVFHY